MRWSKAQLQDPKWQKKRLETFNRDNWSCVLCHQQNNTLHAHHLLDRPAEHNPWEYHDDEIITLCRGCHYNTHQDRARLVLKKLWLESQQRHGWNLELSRELDLVLTLIESEEDNMFAQR